MAEKDYRETNDVTGGRRSFTLDYTGTIASFSSIVLVPFFKFQVSVQLGPDKEFLGIKSISIDKSFLSPEQRRRAIGSIDVSEYYQY